MKLEINKKNLKYVHKQLPELLKVAYTELGYSNKINVMIMRVFGYSREVHTLSLFITLALYAAATTPMHCTGLSVKIKFPFITVMF